MLKESRRGRREIAPIDRFGNVCLAALEELYAGAYRSGGSSSEVRYFQSVRYTLQMLAVLISSERISSDRELFEPLQSASHAIISLTVDPNSGQWKIFEDSIRKVYSAGGISIFKPCEDFTIDSETFRAASKILLQPQPDALIEPIYFQTMPLSWLGSAYQYMLTVRPGASEDSLEASFARRKKRGVYFTPPSLISYITESVLTPLSEHSQSANSLADLKILDPSMGGGDFLSAAVNFLCESTKLENIRDAAQCHADIASNCVYGVDVDPVAVDISRFCVWAASGFADGVADLINSHLVCADTLGQENAWRDIFPEIFEQNNSGFDAVIGNPPYIASKNGFGANSVRPRTIGQSDAYLMFLSTIIGNDLVKRGGYFSMVLPDPMLVRENAASVRRKLVTDWDVLSILHISDAFPDAQVANIVPVCRNSAPDSASFWAARVDCSADRRSFMLRPCITATSLAHSVRRAAVLAQDRCEILYLLEAGDFAGIIKRIHGENACLSNYEPPYTPLRSLNIKAIYRGEEVGKSAITGESGDMPMLMGGQSIRRYMLAWEGRKIGLSKIKKIFGKICKHKNSGAKELGSLDSGC